MDLRLNKIYNSKTKVVKYFPQDNYILPNVTEDQLELQIQSVLEKEYWSPAFQAWKPLLATLLASNVYPNLTLKYYEDLLLFTPWSDPKGNKFSSLMQEWQSNKTDESMTIFDSCSYDQLLEMSNYCRFLYTHYKELIKELQDSSKYNEIAIALLKQNSYTGLAESLLLVSSGLLPKAIMAELGHRVSLWVEDFRASWDNVLSVLPKNKAYPWYCDLVKDSIIKVWESSTQVDKDSSIMTKDLSYSLPPNVSDDLIECLLVSPTYYSRSLDRLECWNSLWLEYFGTAEEFTPNNRVYLLGSNMSSLKTNIDSFIDFYKKIQNGDVIRYMLALKKMQHPSEESYNSYVDDLIFRGFPVEEER